VIKNILSIDVEDWFHILELPGAPALSAWSAKESRVIGNLLTMLDILDRQEVKATLFVLGWIGEQYPGLIREAHARGHEIASHGYAHQLVCNMSPEEFFQDLTRAKGILEDLTGDGVKGFRAPGFSITPETPWAFEAMARAGYNYDSSLFPARRAHGGFSGAPLSPHQIDTSHGVITEFPISVASILGARVCFSGGGYFRLFPWAFIKAQAAQVNAAGRPVIYYLHPRDIDPHQPRLSMGLTRRFKSYVNLHSTEKKLQSLVQSQPLTSFRDWLQLVALPVAGAPRSQVPS
jgi:polysaccharide deacetylase family protein (PEP-CTERM system associated)